MSDNPIRRLLEHGQSIWYDYIRRDLMASGELTRLIQEDGLRGMTSNPTIFDKAIAETTLYDETLLRAMRAEPGLDARGLFHRVAIEDIRLAADAFLPVYEQTRAQDGYVSLEVSPELAHDTEGSVAEARELAEAVSRPNLMIKIPATREGLPAIEQLIGEGISVNVTLLFAVERYQAVLDAYLRGLESRRERGLSIERIASVASFFVSRVDGVIDPLLSEARDARAAPLIGKIAIANAKLAYAHYREVSDSARWEPLAAAGAQPQRLLWASTGTKNPDYSDVLYVDSLIGPDTVNTLPPATYEAFKDHGQVRATLGEGIETAGGAIGALGALDIDLAAITDRLEQEGVASFAKSYAHLLESLEAKRAQLAA
jgi:transaldolase